MRNYNISKYKPLIFVILVLVFLQIPKLVQGVELIEVATGPGYLQDIAIDDATGIVYCASLNGHLYRYLSGSLEDLGLNPGASWISSILVNNDGRVFGSSGNGRLFVFYPLEYGDPLKAGTFEDLGYTPYSQNIMKDAFIRASDGMLYAGTSKGATSQKARLLSIDLSINPPVVNDLESFGGDYTFEVNKVFEHENKIYATAGSSFNSSYYGMTNTRFAAYNMVTHLLEDKGAPVPGSCGCIADSNEGNIIGGAAVVEAPGSSYAISKRWIFTDDPPSFQTFPNNIPRMIGGNRAMTKDSYGRQFWCVVVDKGGGTSAPRLYETKLNDLANPALWAELPSNYDVKSMALHPNGKIYVASTSKLYEFDTRGSGSVNYDDSVPENNQNVAVAPPNNLATLTFRQITGPGVTEVKEIVDGTPPANMQFLGKTYDVSTTVPYSGTILITIPYIDSDIPNGISESDLKLFHYESSTWKNVTISVDTVNNKITGQVTSLSPFSVGYSVSPSGPVISTGYNTYWFGAFALGLLLTGTWLMRRRVVA